MIPLERLFALLDDLRTEALDGIERPPEDMRSEFGFGRASGMLQALREVRERAATIVENAQQAEEPRFEE